MPGPLPKPPYPQPFPAVGPQTSYALDFPLPLPGSLFAGDDLSDIVVGFASVPAFFGIVMSWDYTTGPVALKYPALSADVTAAAAGFVIRTGAIETSRDGLAPNYPAGRAVDIKRVGRNWVNPETAVTNGGAVFVRFTANTPNLQLGAVRNDDDGGKAVALPNAVFKVLGSTSTADGGYPAYVEYNLMGKS